MHERGYLQFCLTWVVWASSLEDATVLGLGFGGIPVNCQQNLMVLWIIGSNWIGFTIMHKENKVLDNIWPVTRELLNRRGPNGLKFTSVITPDVFFVLFFSFLHHWRTRWWHPATVRMFRTWVSACIYPKYQIVWLKMAPVQIHSSTSNRHVKGLQEFFQPAHAQLLRGISTIVDKVIRDWTKPSTKPNFEPHYLMMHILLNVQLQCLNALQA